MSNAAEKPEIPQPYATELVELDRVEAALADLRKKYGKVPDFTTQAGYDKGKKGIRELTSYRTSTDKLRLDITKPHRDFIERVNRYGKDLIGKLEAIEQPLKEAKREVDEAEQRKKEARIAQLRERLEKEVTSYLDTAAGLDSTGLAELIESAEAIDIQSYFDISNEAEDEKARVVRELITLHARTLEQERIAAEQAEIDAQRRKLREEEQHRAAEHAELEELRRFKAEQEEKAKAAAEAERQAKQESPQEPAHVGVDPGAGDDKTVRQPIDTRRISQAADHFQRGSDVATPETVEIPRKEYEALLAAREKLDALEAAGVDNWSGYPDAMASLEAA
jgi:membrane-associated HD superfamily phosphohydrolase